MRSSATEWPGMQLGLFAMSMRVLAGSLGFQVKPRNTAKVKREFTFTIPSRAVMWMLVPPE